MAATTFPLTVTWMRGNGMSNGRGGRSTRQWMLWAFKIRGCVDCGIRPPDIRLDQLHVDHLDPAKKVRGSRRGPLNNGTELLSLNANQSLLDELAGCEPVCFACHKIRTRQRGPGVSVGGWGRQLDMGF